MMTKRILDPDVTKCRTGDAGGNVPKWSNAFRLFESLAQSAREHLFGVTEG
jgi:hypothetical protein